MGLALGAAGQEEATEDRVEHIGGLAFKDETELVVVNIDVVVRDKRGDPILDLTADDFRVFQDGVEKPVSNFALYTKPMPASPAAFFEAEQSPAPETGGAGPKPLYVVLYIDNENLRPFDRNRVLSQTRDFVRDLLQGPAQVMVVSYQRTFEILQPFTSEADEVLAALRRVRRVSAARLDRDDERERIVRDMMNSSQRAQAGSVAKGQDQLRVYSQIRLFADEVVHDTTVAVNAVRSVITMLSGLPGRTCVIYLSNGLPLVPGRDLFHQYSSAYRDSVALGVSGRYSQRSLYESLVSSANAQGVKLYTIDAGGLQTASGVSAENLVAEDIGASVMRLNNHQQPLETLAEGTGGQAILNSNDVQGDLQHLADDLFTYYSVGYSINSSGADKVHRIEVELPGRSDLEVRHRRTFVEKSLETRVQDAVLTGLMFERDDNPMAVELELGRPAPAPEGRSLVPVEVSFPVESVAMLPELEEYVGRVVLFVAVRDRDGKQSDLQRREHEVRMPVADYQTRRHETYAIDLQLLMESGAYRVSVGLMDQVTRQASYLTAEYRVGGEDSGRSR